MGYRLIALDIDGTLRDSEHSVSDTTRQAIARAREAGALVTLATGRILASAAALSKELGLAAPIITHQGALVSDPINGKTLWHRPLTLEMARQALAALAASPLQVVMYRKNEVFVNQMTPWVQGYSDRNGVKVQAVKNLADFLEEEPTRLVVAGKEEEIGDIYIRLKALFNSSLYITRSLTTFCEILHPSSGKARALAWLCKWAGVGSQETIAFGNGLEDLEMLRWAGLGVAMEGSDPRVLEIADRVAPSVKEDGVAVVLEELLSQGLIGL